MYHIDVSKPKTAPIDERIVIDSYIKHEPSQAQMKLKNIQQQSVIDGLGTELTKAKLEIIALKGGKSK
ncbi:arsenate reductase [Paenibacillus popilliae ATCC 14706]|uniref:Arsenate reductase n=1 Tax=Paenibacillus popilliae ATCC 14706 TaxID=1212764 RepID=M9LRW3_PAEPP|nr:arsenate reductase [Paenibacillus popilliae ATCC 14706]